MDSGLKKCLCKCTCGAEGMVRHGNLASGNTKTCRGFKNVVDIDGDISHIYTHTGDIAIIDTEMIEIITQYRWSYNHNWGYFNTSTKGKTVAMHRLIIADKPGSIIDHIDLDTKNNRKNNLRYTTKSINAFNSIRQPGKDGHRGVILVNGKWRAIIKVKGVTSPIPNNGFDTLEEAIAARKAAEIKYFGENSPQYREEELTKKLVTE